jgi:uncharacterized protein (DUF433 family)
MVVLTDPDANKFVSEVAKIRAYVHTHGNQLSELPVTASDYEASRRPRQVQNHLNKAKTMALIAAYRAGVPIKEIATDFGIARQTVTEIYRRAGLEPRQRGLSPAQVMLAARLYGDGASLVTVGKKFTVDAETVRQALHVAGVQVRPRRGA